MYKVREKKRLLEKKVVGKQPESEREEFFFF